MKPKKIVRGAFRQVKRIERGAEKRMRKALGGDTKPKKPAPKPYVHPWSQQDIGAPAIVDEMNREHCCGCGSCVNTCPVSAIRMEMDAEGFYYPVVDHDTCTNCGACVKRCPIYQDQPANRVVDTCYAVIAEDDAMRAQSSSGGLFSQICEYAFARDGVVFGAAYDGPDTVVHKMVDKPEDLDILRRSKYVQCSTGDTYSEVKKLLKEGKFVLYTGCPCHIAGLYAFLGRDYDNLLTVDLICHGSPSPGLFKRYLAENYADRPIQEVNFRDKTAYGWSTHLNIYFEDGSVKREVCSKDPYYFMFLRCLAMRPFCSMCKFTKLPRVADLSIGDWWGIEKFDAKLNDQKGTSLLMVNNDKGEAVLETIKASSRAVKQFPLSDARPRNYTIDRPFKAHPARQRFFELLEYMPFNRAVYDAMETHYDVGIYGLWYGENYGSMLTYYGLRKVIHSMGMSCVMIENPHGSRRGYMFEPHHFARRQNYYITRQRGLGALHELNSVCDAFLLGSDQLWNPGLSKPYGFSYFLSFVNASNKRIAYGTSFGKDTHKIDETYRTRSALELSKFDAISVRDDFSKQLLADKYGGLEATKVLDPALLCDPAEYDALALQARPYRFYGDDPYEAKEGEYLFVYILDPDEQTRNSLAQVVKISGKDIVMAIDYSPKHRQSILERFAGSDFEGIHVLDVPTCEQWLRAIRDSAGVITDSFHGTIFAHVFDKQFTCFPNAKRGHKRFSDLLAMLGLTDRAIPAFAGNEQATCDLLETPIDYEKSNALLEIERKKSYDWLYEALTKPKEVAGNIAYTRVERPN